MSNDFGCMTRAADRDLQTPRERSAQAEAARQQAEADRQRETVARQQAEAEIAKTAPGNRRVTSAIARRPSRIVGSPMMHPCLWPLLLALGIMLAAGLRAADSPPVGGSVVCSRARSGPSTKPSASPRLAIWRDRIIAVGSKAEIRAHIGPTHQDHRPARAGASCPGSTTATSTCSAVRAAAQPRSR